MSVQLYEDRATAKYKHSGLFESTELLLVTAEWKLYSAALCHVTTILASILKLRQNESTSEKQKCSPVQQLIHTVISYGMNVP